MPLCCEIRYIPIRQIYERDLIDPQPFHLWLLPRQYSNHTKVTKFMGPTWGPPGSSRPQMGPMLAPWTLLSMYDCPNSRVPNLKNISVDLSYVITNDIYKTETRAHNLVHIFEKYIPGIVVVSCRGKIPVDLTLVFHVASYHCINTTYNHPWIN